MNFPECCHTSWYRTCSINCSTENWSISPHYSSIRLRGIYKVVPINFRNKGKRVIYQNKSIMFTHTETALISHTVRLACIYCSKSKVNTDNGLSIFYYTDSKIYTPLNLLCLHSHIYLDSKIFKYTFRATKPMRWLSEWHQLSSIFLSFSQNKGSLWLNNWTNIRKN